MSEIIYRILRQDNFGRVFKAKVNGFQIGRFAIRERSIHDLSAHTPGGRLVNLKPFLVDHINTGIILIDMDTFQEAVRVADDVSRFSKRDLSATAPDRFVKQLGTPMLEWLTWVIANRNVNKLDYREYHHARKGVPVHAFGQTVTRRSNRKSSN